MSDSGVAHFRQRIYEAEYYRKHACLRDGGDSDPDIYLYASIDILYYAAINSVKIL